MPETNHNNGGNNMGINNDVLKGKWNQFKGEAKSRWGQLTDDDLTQAEGEYDKLVGKLQERYGYARDKAEQEVDNFLNSVS
jgi:uncharacterized protein YjbJ (UPF0337 family)